MPLISVILPVYNAELYIAASITSILNQTFGDFELLLYDDGSTDLTHEIISSFNDPRIVYTRFAKNSGYLPLLNKGLLASRGKYIARMDADDIATQNRFQEQVDYLENNPDVGICGSWIEFIGAKTGIVELPVSFEDIQHALFFGCPINHPTVMMRKDLLRKFNLSYNQQFYFAEDHFFFSQASHCFKLVNLPKVLLQYRIHHSQIGTAKWKEQFYVKCNIQTLLVTKPFNTYPPDDFEWLLTVMNEQSTPSEAWLDKVRKVQQKILEENDKTKVYPQGIFKNAVNQLFKLKVHRNLYNTYFQKYYNQKNYNLYLLYCFFKEKYKPFAILERKLVFYFVIKCLIGYRKKTVLNS